MFANESRRRTDPNPTETDHLGNVYTKSDVFVYRPLDPTVDCTRFVAIEPADDEDSPVVCRLVHLPFGQRPKFEALSYTWGDDNPNNAITVDGCKFEVRSNLLDALRFLRRQVSQDALFWIDALCINQKDADERNRQLRMMGQIYFRASQVIVWLGRKYSKFQETIERISAESPTANDEETEQDISERTQNKIKDVESALLAKLVSDDYWDRLWIIQEIGQNDEKKVCFGTTSMSWENFIHTVTHHSHFNGEGPLRLDRHLKEKYTGSHTLRRLLVEHRLAKCKDRKDKVYGLVVLAADGHGFPMDYRKSLMEIWTDTMRFMNARQLFHPTSESDIMDMGRLIKSLLMEPHSSPLQQVGRLYEAKTDPKLIIERDHVSNNADVFPVKSYVLGSIVHVGPPARDMVSNIGKANEWAESVQHNFSSDLGEAYEESFTPTVPAQLAYDCLNSVPLGKQEAIDLVDSIVPYLEWQSDAAYKADPPADYDFPAYDMFAALETIRSNLVSDVYTSEYAFQSALYEEVFGPGHDGHFVYYPDLLTAVFEWTRERALVSISEDGSSLPVIKVYEDVVSSPETASAVKLINGIDAAKYLDETINKANWNRDADSAYNSVFFEQSLFATTGGKGYFSSGGRIRYVYQGANTTLTFENGTEVTFENHATIKKALTDVVDGPSFYAKFCNPLSPAADTPASTTPSSSGSGALLPGYPAPVITTPDGVVSGYYLEGEGLEDVAVIVLTAFESESPEEFQSVARDFYTAALAAGKTKLVIDFQQNGGGYILQGYDFFRQLFPDAIQEGNSRWKENDGFNAAAEIVSDVVNGLNVYTSPNADLISYAQTWFNWRYDYNLTDEPFTSYDAKFAPQVFQNTSYTNLMRWNLNDPLTTYNTTFGLGIEINGYGNLTNVTQPFEAENIIILYDGVCASTCTLASEFLRLHGNVKSIAMGGRPKKGGIEGVGGIKGSQVLDWSSIYGFTTDLLKYATTDAQKAAFARYSDLPLNRSLAAAVNVRDQILRDNVEDGIPAQFVKEITDCRLYWTLPMINDVTEVWKAAANAAFNGGKCAFGGITKRDVGDSAEVKRSNYLAASLLQERSTAARRSLPPTTERHWQDKYVLKAID
ncbi:hypothetical protein CkaCkLH20_00599 [Colletotrichum karsti]|uniref:Peptidase S41 family protein ustP n=1 Tax=Colletotrichum karsti TaxID=1095194 RepID=A0A9P6ID96_9PEZI|nr:uncharacterized protein CkaCkLH20_00599 [Colletotrichum karsti]KAF9881453.1 hypothetical protein CkaCkLH20_00599 [Colletotrichum karsti]